MCAFQTENMNTIRQQTMAMAIGAVGKLHHQELELPLQQQQLASQSPVSILGGGNSGEVPPTSHYVGRHSVGVLNCSPTTSPKLDDNLVDLGCGSYTTGCASMSRALSEAGAGLVDTAMPPKKLCTDDIPVLDSFPGHYAFDLYRPLCGDTYEAAETKPSTAFFYFKDEQGWTNLFAKKTPTWWTLSYCCQRQPPEGSFIRLTPVYGTSDKQQEVIQRCFEDFMAIPTSSMGRYSIVLVGNSLADYFFDPTTKRLCVTLPYEKPKEGCEYSQFNGKFMCFNSCLYNGGQGNKKPLFLIITLERPINGHDPTKSQCEVLGRQCIKFRSCACPKRDKENNERRTGDPMLINVNTPVSVKRRRESNERIDRNCKRIRPQTFDPTNSSRCQSVGGGNGVPTTANSMTTSATSAMLANRWQSLNGTGVLTDANAPGLLLDLHSSLDPRLTTSQDYTDDNGNSIIQFDGENYHMLLIPASLPGAVDTLNGVRFGLLRAWMHTNVAGKNGWSSSSSPPAPLSSSFVTDADQTDADGKKLSNGSIDHRMMNSNDDQLGIDYALRRLASVEAQISFILNDRMAMLNAYRSINHVSCGESTDSQPNSAGTTCLSMGSTDDYTNSLDRNTAACGGVVSSSTNGNLGSLTCIDTSLITSAAPSAFSCGMPQQQHQQGLTSTQLIENMLMCRSPLATAAYPVSTSAGATQQQHQQQQLIHGQQTNYDHGQHHSQQQQANDYANDLRFQANQQHQFYALTTQQQQQQQQQHHLQQQQAAASSLAQLSCYPAELLAENYAAYQQQQQQQPPILFTQPIIDPTIKLDHVTKTEVDQGPTTDQLVSAVSSSSSVSNSRQSSTTPTLDPASYYGSVSQKSQQPSPTSIANYFNAKSGSEAMRYTSPSLVHHQLAPGRPNGVANSNDLVGQFGIHLSSSVTSNTDDILTAYLDRDRLFDETSDGQHQLMSSQLMSLASTIKPSPGHSRCDTIAPIPVD